MKKATSEQLLRQHNLRATITRKDVLNALRDARKPVTVEMLQIVLGKRVDIATTYRTLQTLVEQGLIYQTNFRDRKTYYEYQETHHHHAICTKCGIKEETKMCIDAERIAHTLENFQTINCHVLEFFGVCNKCTN